MTGPEPIPPAIAAWLEARRLEAIAKMRAGLPRAKDQAALSQSEWDALGVELLDTMAEFIALSTSLRSLPRTTACVCPSCKRVVLPAATDATTFAHCGRLWVVNPRHNALPADFWDTARPGDIYTGAIAPLWAEEEEQHGSQDEKHRRGARSARKKAS